MDKRDFQKNVFGHESIIKKEDRQNFHGHKSVMIWLTGYSGSGKSTIANVLQLELFKKRICVYVLDGDNLRLGINKDLSHAKNDRKENVRRTAEIGKLFVDAGVVVIAALISPYQSDREAARLLFDKDEFIEIHVHCPIEECEKRDSKGLYNKARNGEILHFTGIDDPYEKPINPEIILDTNQLSIEECTRKIMSYLFDTVKITE